MTSAIVTPPKLRPIKGPVIRLGQEASAESAPKRSAIVEPKRASAFGDAEDMTEEEHRRRGDGADALWRELVRKATKGT